MFEMYISRYEVCWKSYIEYKNTSLQYIYIYIQMYNSHLKSRFCNIDLDLKFIS